MNPNAAINAFATIAGIVVLIVLALGYGRLQAKLSGRRESPDSLDKRKRGYSVADARAYWKGLGPDGRTAEERFLKWDIAYPFVYGGLLGAGVLILCSQLALSVPLVALVAPIAIASVADWIEGLVQLRQLGRYRSGGEAAVEEGPIRLASLATRLKLAFFGLSILILVALVALLLWHAFQTKE